MMELWSGHKFGIAFGIIVVSLLALFAGAAILLEVLIKTSNVSKYTAIGTVIAAIGTIVAAIGGIGALYFVGYQAIHLKRSVDLQGDQIRAQSEEFHLDRRPYLYVELRDLRIWKNPIEKNWFGGGDIYFMNVGQDPATIVDSQYVACSDVTRDSADLKNWFERDFAGFPEIKTVMHGQENLRVAVHPIVGPGDKQPKLLYIGGVISYVGPQKDRKYWYKYAQVFVASTETKRLDGGEVVKDLFPGKADTDWDKNENSDPPVLQVPDWDSYLAKGYIKTVTQRQ